jgi:hypothetical protein
MGTGLGTANTLEWTFTGSSSIGEIAFAFSTNAGSSYNNTVTSSGAGLTTGVWYHLAVDRDASNKFRLYVDGVMVGSATIVGAINGNSGSVCIGAQTVQGTVDMAGWQDEVRITKGVARHASDSGFTVPTAAYPRS